MSSSFHFSRYYVGIARLGTPVLTIQCMNIGVLYQMCVVTVSRGKTEVSVAREGYVLLAEI